MKLPADTRRKTVAELRNIIRKDHDGDEDMGKSLSELSPDRGIEEGKTDDEEDEGTEPKTKRADRNTHQAEAAAGEEKTTHRPKRSQKKNQS